VECQGYKEHEKVSVVSPADAVVHPGAVMIKNLNAVVANTTVTTSRRSVELTRNTPFHTNRNSINFYISVKWSTEVIIPILIWTCSRNHTRIHESGHGEVDQDKDGDDALEDWHSIPVFNPDVPFYTRKIEEECGGSKKQKPGKCCRQEFSF